jgi:hypothetical protein
MANGGRSNASAPATHFDALPDGIIPAKLEISKLSGHNGDRWG